MPEARSSSSAMNMVGTPYKAVALYSCTAFSVATGSNDSVGKTIAEAWVAVAM